MAILRLRRLAFATVVAACLAGSLQWLATSTPGAVRATAPALFAQPSGSGTACTQAAPCALQTAAAQAQASAEIYLAAGTYRGLDAGAVVTVTGGYTLYGGWDGAAAGPVRRDPAVHRSIVDGEGVRQGVHIAGTFEAGLDGLTITSGRAAQGGGVYVYDASVFIRNNVITACQTFTYTTWHYGRGGGICVLSAGPGVIANNLIANNTSGYGAGIYHGYAATMTIEGNDIRSNVAQKRGGGVVLESTDDVFRGNRVANNSAGDNGGGGLLWHSGALVDSNRFLHNSSPYGAGLSLGNGCLANLVNNWIIQSSGDGIAEGHSSPRIVNNTIVGNATQEMGTGIDLYSPEGHGPPYAMVDAILNNTISGFDDGIVARGAVTPTLDYNNVWNSRLRDYDLPAHVVSGTHGIAADPRFASAAGGDYHLRADSPCINAGDPAGVPPAPPLDIDGDPRPFGGRVDVGADEFTGFHWVFLPWAVRQSGP